MLEAGPQARRKSVGVTVGNVTVGGGAPVVVQSMTNTDTADVAGTVAQVAALARAGSEIVRITVDRDEAAKAVPLIRDRLAQMNVDVPLVGDFHYNGHTLLAENPACAEALDKWRINPGNVGFKAKRDRQFSAIIELALRYGKPWWQRVIVMFAGPFHNLVLAVVFFTVMLTVFGTGVITTTLRSVPACVLPAGADSKADCTMASCMTSRASLGSGEAAFSSMRRVSSS